MASEVSYLECSCTIGRAYPIIVATLFLPASFDA